jgi:hypothetical protein
MEKPKRPYSLFKRPTVRPNTYIYYCRFRDENGDYMSPISTSKSAARNWADEKLKEAKIILPGKRGMTFECFASGFSDYEGEYIQRKIARGGHFSRIFAQIRAGQVEKWILPHFQGQTIRSICRPYPPRSSPAPPGTSSRISPDLDDASARRTFDRCLHAFTLAPTPSK